jgi:hypothetical protein
MTVAMSQIVSDFPRAFQSETVAHAILVLRASLSRAPRVITGSNPAAEDLETRILLCVTTLSERHESEGQFYVDNRDVS